MSETIDRAAMFGEMLNAMGRSINDGVMIFSPGFAEVHFVSERLEKLVMRQADVLKRDSDTYLDLIDSKDREAVVKSYKKADLDGWDLTYKLNRRDGTAITVRDVAKRHHLDSVDREVMSSTITVVD